MILKAVRLRNIRSYKETEIGFPAGTVLLSGDIGSGKTSILSAIEFALFGIRRGEIAGSSLLRHGEKEGHVELDFVIDGKEVRIRRTLKRTNTTIKQDVGHIMIDNVRTDATAEELKSMVLGLLGYPRDVLKKGKDLIYRFTVYTPQEEMKAILFESTEDRLDTLRKIFGIDKYKRIRENAMLYASENRARKREYAAKSSGLDEKIKARDEKVQETSQLKTMIENAVPVHEAAKADLQQMKCDLLSCEKLVKDIEKKKGQIKLIEAMLMEKFLVRRRAGERIVFLEKQLESLRKERSDISSPGLEQDIARHKHEQASSEKTLLSLHKEIAKADAQIAGSSRIMEKIVSLNVCPTCEQEVGEEYKSAIRAREEIKIGALLDENKKRIVECRDLEASIAFMKKKIEELTAKEKDLAVHAEKRKALAEKELELGRHREEQASLKQEIGNLNAEKMQKSMELSSSDGLESEFNRKKESVEKAMTHERDIAEKLLSLRIRTSENEKLIKLYDDEISRKSRYNEEISRIDYLNYFIEQHFIGLMTVMEKNVMGRIYAEFNEMFTSWFRMLVEDEALSVRLDDQFTPIVNQNGYETSLIGLSGGEKTAVSLAYRLALNKVINDFVTHVKTRDLIILDEPTDGFSDEQLDRVREVLQQLKTKQTIIVSHEAKIESFVDEIIRVRKEEHISRITI